MKMRHVFSTPDLDAAQRTIEAGVGAGIPDDDILLVARSDIEVDGIPDNRKEADTDMMPAALRGACYGALAGLVLGLIAMAVEMIGLNWIGVVAMVVAGSLVGAWGSALMGSSLQDPIRRQFHDEIEAGRVLVIIDGSKDLLTAAEPAIVRSGAAPLPFEASKTMS